MNGLHYIKTTRAGMKVEIDAAHYSVTPVLVRMRLDRW